MSGVEFRPDVRAFLAAFFSPPHPIRWEVLEAKLAAGSANQALAPWIERLARAPDSPTLLPVPNEKGTTWYALAHSFSQIDQLREELLAAVGPSYSDFVGHRADLTPDHPLERAVLAFTGGHAMRLFVPERHRDSARTALDRLRQLWELRPSRSTELVRTVGRVVREFELALAVRDLGSARERLDELRSAGMLDARNILFQEIRVLAADERWSEIMRLEALPDLAQVRCPVVVAEGVLQALYAVEFEKFELQGGPEAALEHFRAHALGRWSSFFRVKSTMRSPAALKLFMMLAVSSQPLRPELMEAVLAESGLTPQDRAYCERIAALAPAPDRAPPELQALARERHDAGDYDAAFPAALAAPPSAERLRILLTCAVELARLDAICAVLATFSQAPVGMREQVLQSARYRLLWEHLSGAGDAAERPEEGPPQSWVDWIERLNERPEWPKAVEVAEQGSREWEPQAFLRDGEAVARFRSSLASGSQRSRSAQAALRDAVPYLIAFLTREPELIARASGLLEDILLLLTEDEQAGAAHMSAIKEVVAALVELGPPASEYRSLVAFLKTTWDRLGAPRRLEWLIEAFETLVLCPASDPAARIEFAELVFSSTLRWRSHISADQWRLLELLSRDAGLGDRFAAVAPQNSEPKSRVENAQTLTGKSVVIHSLMERPAQHARDVLLSTHPGVKVELNADHVATERLREQARRADVFVMVYRASKHAATMCIEASRPKHLPLLRPDGRSATSIIRAATGWCGRQEGLG